MLADSDMLTRTSILPLNSVTSRAEKRLRLRYLSHRRIEDFEIQQYMIYAGEDEMNVQGDEGKDNPGFQFLSTAI